jgi:hypothetical protein
LHGPADPFAHAQAQPGPRQIVVEDMDDQEMIGREAARRIHACELGAPAQSLS